jgi:GDP-L-fucose synthase
MNLTKNSRIYVAGHNGMVGSAVCNLLKRKKYNNIITVTKKNLDLLSQEKTENFLKKSRPNFVIIAAARVGGILINQKNKADFIYQNLTIQNNLIHSSYKVGVKKLIFLGSSCIYPKLASQPLKEKYLLNGMLEETNDAYAIAKIAGIKMCEAYNQQYGLNYICLMPTNLYGPNDNYNLNTSHFFPALLSKIMYAKRKKLKEIVIWGNGKPKRELMHVDDLANACEFFLKKKTKHNLINIGSGIEKSISQYAKFIMKKIGIKLEIKYDLTKPNGTPRKLLDSGLAKTYGWKSKINLDEGFELILKNYLNNYLKF